MKRYAAIVRDADGNEIHFAETTGECQRWCAANNITGENGEYIATGTFDEESKYFEMEDTDTINNNMYKEEITMTNTNTIFKFEQGGGIYESTESGRFFYTNPVGKKTRIGKLVFEAAFKQYVKKNGEAPKEQTPEVEPEKTETIEVSKKEKPKAKKTNKPKTKKVEIGGMEFDDNGVKIILTAKQVDFFKHLPDTCFWEDGVKSVIWTDCLCDDIGGQFAAKPMTVGAMISTLCEKGLGIRSKDRRENRKCTSFRLTELGQKIAVELGL